MLDVAQEGLITGEKATLLQAAWRRRNVQGKFQTAVQELMEINGLIEDIEKREEELKAKGKAEAAAVLEANKAKGQAGKDAAANAKAAREAKKEEGKAAARAKREADLAAQAEKAAAKKAKKAAAKK